MSNSDASWFKKFLGEDPNAKALRERLEEATVLLASKEEALVESERRLTEATALAQRESESARALQARVRELTETIADTDLSRSVTIELLKQAEAQANQMSDALAAERAKLVASNQAKAKAETHSRTLGARVQKLEAELSELRSKVTSLEQERASAQEAKVMLETALSRSERRRESTLAELTESRATGEKLSIACEDREARLHALARQLEERDEAWRQAQTETTRTRNAAAELAVIAASSLYAAAGHTVPVALRLGAVAAAPLNPLDGGGPETTPDDVVTTLERWFNDLGLSVTLDSPLPDEVVIGLTNAASTPDRGKVALGHWLGGLTMQRLHAVTHRRYRLSNVEVTDRGVHVTLTVAASEQAAE